MFFRYKRAKPKYAPQRIGQRVAALLGLRDDLALYIMTLGVVNELRGRGVAQRMVAYLKGSDVCVHP